MTYQTSVQQSNTIRFGSAKIEIGETLGTLTNLGLAGGIEFNEEFEPIILKPDNAPELQVGNRNHTASVKFELWEVNLENLYLIRGGMDTAGNVAGSSTPVTGEAHTLTGIAGCRLNHKNGAGTVVTSISVTDAASNAAVQNTDYVIYLDSEGWTNIARVSGSTVISTGEGVLVNYTYTPNAAKTLTSGGLSTVSPRIVRLTNTNAAGKVFRLTIYSAKNQKGITLKLPADDDENSLKPEIELKGIIDTTRTAGDQLFEIYDEQGVAA